MKRRNSFFILVVLLLGSASLWAHDTIVAAVADSLVASVDSTSYPEWYVAPEIPDSLRAPFSDAHLAPGRARAAAACPVDSILTFNIDSVLTEGTYYTYDASGRVICTAIWTYNPDGSRIGKSKQEYGYTSGKQTMTATYEWDNTTNDWKGTAKSEYVYQGSRMISNTSFVWLNATWVPDIRYTYAYDAAGRNTEYFEYNRNTTTNQLDPSQGFVYEWLDNTQKSLEIIYTAYSNGAWSSGTKKEWAFDAEGNQTLYAYSTISNGNWIGSSKEEWEYTDGVLTMNAKYGWANGDWSGTLKEVWGYTDGTKTLYEKYTGYSNGNWVGSSKEEWGYTDGVLTMNAKYGWANGDWSGTLKEVWGYTDGTKTLYEKYTAYSNGNWVGSLKETWSYTGSKLTLHMQYGWGANDWVNSAKEQWTFNAAGKQTLHEQYEWANSDWSVTLRETNTYEGANLILVENYKWVNGVKIGTKKEETVYTSGKKTSFITYTWESNDWVGVSKEIWTYTSGKLTLHEKSEWENGAWTVMLQENTTYNGNTTIVENYERIAGVWTGTKKEENTVVGGKKTLTIIYAWENDAWVGASKESWAYTSGKQTKHEQFIGANGGWIKTLEENTAYSGSNTTMVENYALVEDVWTGTQKEEYAYTSGQKTQTIIYAWFDNDWVESTKEVWAYTSGKQTKHETYEWYNNDWSVTLRELSAFDTNGNQTLVENYIGSSGIITGTKKEEYTFTNGAKTMTITYTWSNSAWVYATKKEAGYQEGNIKFSEASYTWKNGAWVGSGTVTRTTYDDNNRETEVLKYNWPTNATEWTNYTRTLNTYNADGEKILVHNARWMSNKWVMASMKRTDIIIDEQGRTLLNASWSCSSDSIWKGVQKDTASYSSTGNWLYQAHYTSWKNNKWVLSYEKRREYDAAGNMLLDERYEMQSNRLVGDYKYEYAFDEQGRPTMTASYKEWSTTRNDWIGSSKKEVTYNTDGTKATELEYTWNNGDWAYRYIYTYQYDSQGHETEVLVQRWYDPVWRNFEKYTKEYSGSKLVKNNVYSWSSDEWRPQSLSELYYDEDSQAKLRREITGSWNSEGAVLSFADNHYFYPCDPRFYDIRFVNYDGTLISSSKLGEGETPVFNGVTPSRPEDAQYTYNFTGWDKEIVAATAHTTYTATYSTTTKSYTITWLNDDNSLIDETTVAYGVVPTHDNATKANTAEYTYTFTGWDTTPVAVTGVATYKATYSATKNSYTVTFKNGEETLQSTAVEYGEMPNYTGATPSKPADAENTYTFTGWDAELASVTGEATYNAVFSSNINAYTITWLNDDNSLIDETTVAYGVVPTHDNATKANTAEYTYTFTGWDTTPVAVTGVATYKATYSATKNSYTVTFKNGEQVLQSTAVEYGTVPTYSGVTPTKPADAENTYTFTGWDAELASVTGEATYNAVFSSNINSYTITWLNDDNSLIDETTVAYGVVPTHDNATKANTAEWTYTFTGWDTTPVAVTGVATYKATYSASKNSYTVTFKNGDEVLQSTSVEYGTIPTYSGATPTKPADAENTYTFTGWDAELASVTGEATYNAVFSSNINSYTITWLNDDNSLIDETTVAYGVVPTHNDATKANTAEYTYTFTGWDTTPVAVTGVATYKATYSATKNSYTVTFKNGEQVLQSTSVEYGTVPTYSGATPTKPADAENTYTFTGWDAELASVTGEATYNAVFSSNINAYTITWLNDDNSLIDETTVAYGVVPTHDNATKANTAEYTYTFTGWDTTPVAVTGVATYKATYSATKNSYTITFQNGEQVLQSTSVEYGEMPNYTGATPTKQGDAENTYTFTGWDTTPVAVTGEATYNAVFSSNINAYTITWLNDDNSLIDETTVAYGVVPTHDNATKANTAEWTYTFTGWDNTPVAVTGVATYKATYSATKNNYTVTFKNGEQVLQSTSVEYGEMPNYTGAEPTKQGDAENTYTFTGWDAELASVTGEAIYNAVFSSNINSYTITWLNDDNSLIDETTVAYGVVPTHDNATKANTAEWTYTFTGWDNTPVAVTGVATYKATYSVTKNSYTITFMNGEQVLQSTSVEYGEMPNYTGATPTKQGDAENTYTFTGWDAPLTAVTGNATYTATFVSNVNTALVTFMNGEEVLQSTAVTLGTVPSYNGATPTKEGDAQYTYTFVGWDREITSVTGEATYTAVFDQTIRTYTVTFYFEDGTTVLDQMTLPYGQMPSTTYTPSRSAEEHCYYSFAGWYPELAPVTGDVSYTPTYVAHYYEYTIIFKNYDRKELQRSKVPYGTTPSYDGDEPTRPRTAQYTYTFAGWSPELTAVEGDATYTAVYDATLNSYTIIFVDEDGTELDRAEVEYGTVPTTTVTPSKEEDDDYTYTFAGWSPKLKKVTGDATYTATYKPTAKVHESLDDVPVEQPARKVLIDDMIYILRGGKTYTVTGALVE